MIVPVLVWSALVLWPADDNSPWVDVRLRYEKTQGDGKEQLKNLPEEVFTNGWKSACLVYLVKGQYHDRGLCEDRLASYALLLLWRPVDGFACPVLGWGCRALDLREGSVVATSSDTRDNNPGVLAVVSNRLAQRDLRYARFEGAKIIGVDWSSSNLHGALFDRAKLTDVRFGEADLDGVSFVGAVFTKAEFRGTKMRGTILRRASMDGALLEDVDALRADFAGVTAAGMTVKGGVYVDSCWYKARLFELTVSLSDTDGSPAMVRPDKTSGAPVPEGCALPTLGARRVCGANDVVAKQPPSSPQGVAKLPIRRASFAGARMCNAELAGARLAKADFSRVAFDAAVLIGAIFTDVHVSDARFPSANLYLVRFDAVRGRTDKLDPPRASAGAVRSSGTELGAIHGANPIEGSTLDNDRCPDETGKVIREALLTICRSEPETKAVMRNLYPDSRYRAVDMPPLLPTITQCVETTMQKEPCKAIWEKMSKP